MKPNRGRAYIVLAALLAVSSCAGIEETKPLAASKSVAASSLPAPKTLPEKIKPAPKAEQTEIGLISVDPLAEVEQFWAAGLVQEARDRFWRPDVRALSQGARSSEWSIWRGKLYMRRWKGSDLGLLGENVSALLSDNDDVWVGTWTGGVARLSRPLNDSVIWDPGNPSLAVRTVNRIRKQNELIWLVRYGALERYSLRTSTWIREADLPVSERLQDVFLSGNDIYLGTLGKGLWKKSGRSWDLVPQPGIFINRLEPGSGTEILVCTMDRGLFVFEPISGTWSRPPDHRLQEVNVTSALVFGDLIIGGTYGSGAFVWDRSTSEVRFIDKNHLGDPWVLGVAQSGEWVYFGTFGAGVNAWNTSTGDWDRISLPEGLPSGDIAAIYTDSDGAIWIGTLGGGIVRVERGIHGS